MNTLSSMSFNIKHIVPTIRILLILFGSILAGYSLIDVNPEILLKLTDFKYMFVVNFFMAMGIVGFKFTEWKKDIVLVFTTALLFTTIVYVSKRKFGLVRMSLKK